MSQAQAQTQPAQKAINTPPIKKPTKLLLADTVRNVHHWTVEDATTVNDLLKPEYWVHVAKSLNKGDVIICDAENGAYRLELMVQDKGPLWAKVVQLNFYDLRKARKSADVAEEASDYEIKHNGGGKFSVVQKGIAEPLVAGLEGKPAAEQWLTDHKAKMKAA